MTDYYPLKHDKLRKSGNRQFNLKHRSALSYSLGQLQTSRLQYFSHTTCVQKVKNIETEYTLYTN